MCHLQAASNLQAAWQEACLLLPGMILRLRWSVVNPKWVEIHESCSSGGTPLEFPSASPASLLVSENTVVELEIVENYETQFFS